MSAINRARYHLILSVIAVAVSARPVPFEPSRGLVEIEVTVNGLVKGTFGIDTGADRLYIDRQFAEENGLKLGPTSENSRVAGIEGSSEAAAVHLRSLRVSERETLYNLTATAVDMARLGGKPGGYRPDGLIGFDILRRFYVTVDYPGRTMELISHEPDFIAGGDAAAVVPFRQDGHVILVDVVFDDTVKAPMIFDFCASHTTIEPPLAEMLGYAPDESRQIMVGSIALGTDSGVASSDVQVVVMDHSNLRQSVSDSEFYGLLGASFFYRWKITVDYRRRLIYIH
ncbi:MAG: aspartyl protease family protein [Candidatus Zixiibacteriota bacterium]|nr:MAG: aspartyl protease family protein [candidate division Zixibacteria bacterium]